ncbi:MAG TPA: glycosyltransferase [Acidimicrobiales bacterium]|nr:glycosyltransferase [Acidimicrobiales bacterium]
MTRIDQLVVSAVPGDAITTAALELQPLLAQMGPSGLYARYIHPDMEHRFEFPEARAALDPTGRDRDVIVYHASIGEPTLRDVLLRGPERLVVNYHNVSPAEVFRPFDAEFAGRLEAGREEVAVLAGRAVLALANSAYSAAELTAVGYKRVRVAPLLPDWQRLLSASVPTEVQHRVDTFAEGPVVLFVGQLLPHKRPDFLVQTAHVLTTYLRGDARLVLVGAARLPRYEQTVRTTVAELNLDRYVELTGAVTDAELAAWYRRADVFFSASEHEGLGIPLIEAMAFDVPVVARDRAAVPETVGDAALLLPGSGSCLLAAEAINRVLADRTLRTGMIERGRARLADFDPARSRATFRDQLTELVG